MGALDVQTSDRDWVLGDPRACHACAVVGSRVYIARDLFAAY